MNRKPIATYCKQEMLGWDKLPSSSPDNAISAEFSCGFIRCKDGIHLMASVKDFEILNVIHLSVGPIKSLNPTLSDQEWEKHILSSVRSIANDFFGERDFVRRPDDPRKPSVKHYISVLGVNE